MAMPPSLVSGGIDERSANASTPMSGLHEDPVQLGEAVMALDHCETDHLTIHFGHSHFAAIDESQREFDRLGVRLEMRAVFRIGQGGAPLKVFEILPFRRARRPEPNLSAP